MNYIIRELKETEIHLLDDFIYESIFLKDDTIILPRSIIEKPEVKVYTENWGKPDDMCLVAVCDGKVCGAVWTRIINGYGHIDNETPEFAISLYREYRGHGIGTAMMRAMLSKLREKGYKQASLAVQKENYAVRMYKKAGFETVDENEQEYIMICRLS
ncbi:MAG: GNAT family N-acetyltransferase [Oscillospiraceae bacterium]|nr:GNAT family N-acetyltransferase [Oscillospiraceae bacterium]